MKKVVLIALACVLMAGCNQKAENSGSDTKGNVPVTDEAAEGVDLKGAAADGDKAQEIADDSTAGVEAPKIVEDDGTPRCEERFCTCGSGACAKNETCRAGKCYCGVQETIDENYICKEVFTHPIGSKDEASSYRYVCNSAEGCQCGENVCAQNAACVNGECFCGARHLLAEETGYECYLVTDNQYDYVCKQSDGCKCGTINAAVNMGCNGKNAVCNGSPVPGRGLACRPKPHAFDGIQYKYHLACFKDECDCYGKVIKKDEICEPLSCDDGFVPGPQGCLCGREVDHEKEYKCITAKGAKRSMLCAGDVPCACGETQCNKNEICLKGECVDRASLKPISGYTEAGFRMVQGLPRCDISEGCACGKKKCEQGKYCMNGTCYKDPYSRKIGDKVYYYHLVDENVPEDGVNWDLAELWELMFLDLETPLCQKPFKNVYIESNGQKLLLCDSADHKEMTVSEFLRHCGIGVIPDDVGKRYCKITMDRTAGDADNPGILAWGW